MTEPEYFRRVRAALLARLPEADRALVENGCIDGLACIARFGDGRLMPALRRLAGGASSFHAALLAPHLRWLLAALEGPAHLYDHLGYSVPVLAAECLKRLPAYRARFRRAQRRKKG